MPPCSASFDTGGTREGAGIAGHLHELHDQVVPAAVGQARRHLRLARLVADVVARHVVHREDAHRVAEILQRGIDLVRQRAVFDQEVRFAVVVAEQRVADEARVDARVHRDLAHAAAEVHQRRDHARAAEVVEKAARREADEASICTHIEAGETTMQIYDFH